MDKNIPDNLEFSTIAEDQISLTYTYAHIHSMFQVIT